MKPKIQLIPIEMCPAEALKRCTLLQNLFRIGRPDMYGAFANPDYISSALIKEIEQHRELFYELEKLIELAD